MTARATITSATLTPVIATGPYVVREGIVRLAGHDLRIYELSDGRRVLSAEDVVGVFEPPQG